MVQQRPGNKLISKTSNYKIFSNSLKFLAILPPKKKCSSHLKDRRRVEQHRVDAGRLHKEHESHHRGQCSGGSRFSERPPHGAAPFCFVVAIEASLDFANFTGRIEMRPAKPLD